MDAHTRWTFPTRDFTDEGRRILFTFVRVGIAVPVTFLATLLAKRSAPRPAPKPTG